MRFFKGPADHVAVALLLLLSVVLHLELLPYAFDDAYIHVRVAERLATEGEPYYNAGQPVMASSSPGWTLLLAALFALLGPGLWPIAAVNAFLSVLVALLAAELVGDLAGDAASRASCWLVAVVGYALVHFSSVGLMETPLALAAALAGSLLFLRGRRGAFLALGAAPFLRVELAVLVLGLLAWQLLRRRVGSGRALVFSALGAAPFLVYQLFFFGTAMPHTASAKRLVYDLTLADSLRFLVGLSLPGHPVVGVGWVGLALAALALLAIVAVVGYGLSLGPKAPAIAWILAGSAAVTAAVYVGARGLVFPWYVPLLTVPFLVAAATFSLRGGSPGLRLLLLVGLVVPCGLDLASSAVAAWANPAGFRYFADNARVRQYRAIGADLYARYPEARLLSSEIGGLGHAFRGELLDAVGLITPAALAYHPMPVPEQRSAGYLGAIPVGYVRDARPELIVSMDIFVEAFVRSEEREAYVWSREPVYLPDDLARAGSGLLWGSRFINVFVRRDLVERQEEP